MPRQDINKFISTLNMAGKVNIDNGRVVLETDDLFVMRKYVATKSFDIGVNDEEKKGVLFLDTTRNWVKAKLIIVRKEGDKEEIIEKRASVIGKIEEINQEIKDGKSYLKCVIRVSGLEGYEPNK